MNSWENWNALKYESNKGWDLQQQPKNANEIKPITPISWNKKEIMIKLRLIINIPNKWAIIISAQLQVEICIYSLYLGWLSLLASENESGHKLKSLKNTYKTN